MLMHGHVVAHAGGQAQGYHHHQIKNDERNQSNKQPVHSRLPSIDGCASIDAIRAAPSSRRTASPTVSSRPLSHVQIRMRLSRLPLNTEQDIRDNLIKSFMCDHYSTMHWTARDRNPSRLKRTTVRVIDCTVRFRGPARNRTFFFFHIVQMGKKSEFKPSHHLHR